MTPILKRLVVLVALVLVQTSLLPMLALRADADPIQDFCVADGTSTLTVNGLLCKRAADVKASEFLFRGLDRPGNIDNPTAKFAATLHAGDVFVFPRGLVHFQLNVGQGPAVAIAALSSQNPGVQQVGRALFASSPAVHDQVLQQAFGINQKAVHHIRSNFKA